MASGEASIANGERTIKQIIPRNTTQPTNMDAMDVTSTANKIPSLKIKHKKLVKNSTIISFCWAML